MYLSPSLMSDEKLQGCQSPLVLVVEDNDDSLLLVSYTLELLGYRFIAQRHGWTTLLVAQEYQPDLILLDIFLPDISGLDVLRYLKQEQHTRHIPVVAVTALVDHRGRDWMIELGFDDFISKPYLIEELEAVILAMLKQKFPLTSVLELCQE